MGGRNIAMMRIPWVGRAPAGFRTFASQGDGKIRETMRRVIASQAPLQVGIAIF